MKSRAWIAVAVGLLLASGCRLNSVYEGGGRGVGAVEEHPLGVVAVDCAFDGIYFGDGLVLLREDGTAEQLLDCGVFSPGVAPNGDIYVGVSDDLTEDFRVGAVIVDPVSGDVEELLPMTTAGPTVNAIEFGRDGAPYLGATELTGFEERIYRAERAGDSWQLEVVPGTEGLGRYEFVIDPDGSIVGVVEGSNQVVRVDPTGQRSVVAGTGVAGFSGDGGPATQARLASPHGVDRDVLGNLLIADTFNRRIRIVWASSGEIGTSVGGGDPAQLCEAGGVLATNGALSFPTEVAGGPPTFVADTGCGELFEVDVALRDPWALE